jgi:threonine synthase
MSTSYLSHLECSLCGQSFSADALQTYCQACRAPLTAVYDLDSAHTHLDREEIRQRPRGMWRWGELLPVREANSQVTLGEGDTPLLHMPRLGAALGLSQLYVKEESLNPTGSFKARGLAAAVSKAKELRVERLVIPTAGNAGGALAAYAARAGLQAYVIMPTDTPRANIEECRIAGATVQLVEGLISDAAKIASEMASELRLGNDWFDVSTFKEPYRLEGKKVMGYELAEAFGWELPEVILYPTGGGTGLVGMWKAFDELERLGWLEKSKQPRMASVQAAGCAPVVKAFDSGADRCEFWEGAETYASGLRVPKIFADRSILQCLRESHGIALAVTDAEMRAAQAEWGAAEGIHAAPEGAATLAALHQLVSRGWIGSDERVVLFNTASGLKYLE